MVGEEKNISNEADDFSLIGEKTKTTSSFAKQASSCLINQAILQTERNVTSKLRSPDHDATISVDRCAQWKA